MTAAPGKILFLCTGNICRSAFGQHQLARTLEQQVPGAYEVTSAGTHMNPRLRPPQQILDLADGTVLEALQAHAPTQLQPRLAQQADLILAATEEHLETVLQETPAALNRTFTILEFAALAELMAEQGTAVEGDLRSVARTAARMRSRVRSRPGSLDLADPYGGPDSGYPVMAEQLNPAVESIARLLVRVSQG